MAYYIDLSLISIDNYKDRLKEGELLPSRMILKEKLDERFNYFKGIGIGSVLDLQKTLKKKDKLAELSGVDCFKGDYLAILLREINSMHPKPNKISDFIGISTKTVAELEKTGIKDSFKFYDAVKTKKNRKELVGKTGISEDEITELTKLCDLSRIKWVGSTFARMLYDVGTDTAEKASKADYVELHKKINQINKEKKFFKGQIGLNDMKLFVNAAAEVQPDIEYDE